MAKARETFRKKEHEDKKRKKQKEKAEKKEARKANAKSGSLEDMMAYVDEYGRITSTPPDPSKKALVDIDQIEVSVAKQLPPDPADLIRKGTVKFFNEGKGYGFIYDDQSGDSVFFHVNNIKAQIAEKDKVSFETQKGPRGLTAVNIEKV